MASIATAALAVLVVQPVDHAQLLAWGERLASSPWSPPVLIALQVMLYAMGMPGALMLWVIAPFFGVLAASALLVAGSVAGAATAYGVARTLGAAGTESPGRRGVFRILARRGDFLTQCALRVLPGFPHAAVNFAGGLLRLPMAPFLAAATLGLAVKWPIYVYAVHALLAVDEEREPAAIVVPLLLVAALLALGGGLRRYFSRRVTGGDN